MASMANMGENSRQLLGPIYFPKPVSDILVDVSTTPDFSLKLSKLDFYVHSFEEEMRKIDAFKRELPFSMQILKEAIEMLQKERVQWREKEGTVRAKWGIDMEKRTWLSPGQLWTTPVQYDVVSFSLKSRLGNEKESGYGVGNSGNEGGANLTFQTPPGVAVEQRTLAAVAEPVDLEAKEGWRLFRRRAAAEQEKKQRRCWSPELHKSFVDALQRLGGPNTATPKQIRALMKVEGLTNDQIKSHLQKYRLHIKKLPRSLMKTSGYSWLMQTMSERMTGHSASGSPQDHLNLDQGDDTVREDEDQ